MLSLQALFMLSSETLVRPFHGKLLTLGKQTPCVSLEQLKQMIHFQTGIELPNYRNNQIIPDTMVAEILGFSSINAMDNSAYEGADIIYNLNDRALSKHLIGAFDVILDIGVIEHVFDMPSALWNIHQMLKVGGRFILFTTCIYWIDQAYYMMSPTLFHDYYRLNDYEINDIKVIGFPKGMYHNNSCAELVIDYIPGKMDNNHFGIDGRLWDTFVVVTKKESSTWDKKPCQRSYVEQWQKKLP